MDEPKGYGWYISATWERLVQEETSVTIQRNSTFTSGRRPTKPGLNRLWAQVKSLGLMASFARAF